MQINSLSPNFAGKRDNINAFINLDDTTIRQTATLKTLQSIDTDKHRKLNKALGYALPAAFGLKFAAKATKGNRLGAFAYGTAGAATFLIGAGIASNIGKFISKKSETLNNFEEKHPFLSFLGGAAVAFAAGALAFLGGAKVFDKVVTSKGFNKLANSIKNTKFATKTSEYASKAVKFVSNKMSKLPSALKETAKVAADWAPLAVLGGLILHTADHINKVNKTYATNYSNLKEKQLNLARRRNVELQVQNDFLLTNQQNKDDLTLVKNPKKDLPQEIIEKLAEIQAARA